MLIICITIIGIVLRQHYRFCKYLKEGDKVDYYINDSRDTYELINKHSIFSDIKSRSGVITRVLTRDLLPTFYYKYEN